MPDFSRSTAARAIARLMTREPWLPPKTSRRRVVAAGSSGGIAKNSGRTGVPVTTPGLRKCALAAARPTAVRVAKRLRKRLATPGHRVGLVDQRRDAERARGGEHRHRHVAADADDRRARGASSGARAPRRNPFGSCDERRELVADGLADEARGVHELERKAGRGDDLAFEALGRPDEDDVRRPASARRISSASAMPGRMWPPVPPAAMTKAPRSVMADVPIGDSATSCCEMLRMRPPAIQEATSDEPP